MSDSFDPVEHVYRRDGQRVWSATQILDFYFPQTAPPSRMEHARLRGQVVHEMILAREQGADPRDVELFEGLTEEEVMGRYKAYEKFRNEVPIKIKVAERWRIANDHGYLYGVTPDLEVEIDGLDGVIECKNTYSPEITHPLQTAAQAMSMDTGFSTARYALYLKKDGTYRLKAHDNIRNFDHWRAFLIAFSTRQGLLGEK